MQRQPRRLFSKAHLGALALAAPILGILAPSGCGPTIAEPIAVARKHAVTLGSPGVGTAPWGRCVFATDSPNPSSNGGPIVCPDPHADHEGPWSCTPDTEMLRFDNGYVYCQAWAVCMYSCNAVADCPAAPGGHGTLACMNGSCLLTCASSADCPDGMACPDGTCMWFYADYCDNGAISPADPCAGKATNDPCQICDGCDAAASCNALGECQCAPGACGGGP
jgi:hypothetical protein